MSTHPSSMATPMLRAWDLATAALCPIAVGHINATWRVDAGSRQFVLQRLNPMFKPEVNLDIDIITQHLESQGLCTPRLVRCTDGAAWATDATAHTWRLLTFVAGECFERATGAEMVEAAGSLLGRFHRALHGLEHTFAAPRLGVHDTARHLAGLRQALERHRDHVAYASIAELGHKVLEAGAARLDPTEFRSHIVHGDPKLSNIIFASPSRARALVDLDTLAAMPITDELGDALRSWCNINGEAPGDSSFDRVLFQSALTGWSQAGSELLDATELAALPRAPANIALELCARFVRDALEQTYFGWDATRYDFSWQHQLDRARSQWAVQADAHAQRADLEGICRRIFGRRLTLLTSG